MNIVPSNQSLRRPVQFHKITNEEIRRRQSYMYTQSFWTYRHTDLSFASTLSSSRWNTLVLSPPCGYVALSPLHTPEIDSFVCDGDSCLVFPVYIILTSEDRSRNLMQQRLISDCFTLHTVAGRPSGGADICRFGQERVVKVITAEVP